MMIACIPDKPTLFLDFDGVLHRRQNGSFEHLEGFEWCVQESGMDIQIVISSNWRVGASLDHLRSHFSPSFRHFIVGATREIECASRLEEILDFSRLHKLSSWIAVDDDSSLLSGPCDRLFCTQYDAGLDSNTLPLFREFMNQWKCSIKTLA